MNIKLYSGNCLSGKGLQNWGHDCRPLVGGVGEWEWGPHIPLYFLLLILVFESVYMSVRVNFCVFRLILQVIKLKIIQVSNSYHINNHKAWTWDYRMDKYLNLKLLSLDHLLNNYFTLFSILRWGDIYLGEESHGHHLFRRSHNTVLWLYWSYHVWEYS